MSRFSRKIMYSGAVFGMALGLSGPEKGDFIDSTNRKVIERAYGDFQRYWTSRGAGLAALKLVILEKYQEMHLEDQTITGNKSVAFYNNQLDEVVITKGFIDWIAARNTNRPAGKIAALTYVVGHELAHAVQDEREVKI